MEDSPLSQASLRPIPFHIGRPLTCAALCYGAGVLLGASRPFHWLWAAGLAAACLFAVVWFLGKRTSPLGLLPAFFFLGLVLASLAAFPARPPEGTYALAGTVEGRVRLREEDGQVAVTLRDVTWDGENLPGKAYWTYYLKAGEPAPAFENGSRVSFIGTLYHPRGQQNPYGFDFDLYLKQRGVVAGLYGRDGLESTPVPSLWAGNLAWRLRTGLAQALHRTMGGKAALASVMLLGADDLLPEEAREDFRITGTAHILSISGLHIAYLAGMAVWFLKLLKVKPKTRFWVVAAFLAAYSWLVGGSAPVVRSMVMFLLFLGAKPLGRAYDPLTSTSGAFLLLLLFRPLDLLSPGFQLSFGAVAGMTLLGEPLLRWQNRLFPGKKKKRKKERGLVRQYLHKQWVNFKTLPALGIAAQLGIALPLAAFYNTASVLGIFVNLLVIPYTGVLMLFYLLALVFSPLGFLGQWIGTIAGWLTDGLLGGVAFAADVPGMAVRVPSPAWPVIVGGVALLLLFSPYVVWRGRKRAVLIAITAVFAVSTSLAIANRAVRFVQFSCGNADAAILEDGAYTAVIDTGETGTEVADYLLAQGRGIDALLLSHLHADHVGGVARLLEEGIAIKAAYLPEGAEQALQDETGRNALALLHQAGIPVKTLHAGNTLAGPRTLFTVLWPQAGTVRPGQDANPSSLVCHLQMEGVSLLTTGDMTSAYEKYSAVRADILKVAHHGSGGGTSNAFLDAVQPQIAIISASGRESLPSPRTLERLAARPIHLYRTDVSGAITLIITGESWQAIPFIKE